MRCRSFSQKHRLDRLCPAPEQPPPDHVYTHLIINDSFTGKDYTYSGWIRKEYKEAEAKAKMGMPVPPETMRVAMAEIQRIMKALGHNVALVQAAPYKTEPRQAQKPWATQD